MTEKELKFKDLQELIRLNPTNRPLNIYELMHKYGYKHYVKKKEGISGEPLIAIQEKQSGVVSLTQPSKDYRFYYCFDKDNNLLCYATEQGIEGIAYENEELRKEALAEPIYTDNALDIYDLVFYEYGSVAGESLLDFVKRVIYREIANYTLYLVKTHNKEAEECKDYLKALQNEIEKCNEETINIFIYAIGTFALTNAIFFQTYDTLYPFREYVNNLINEYKHLKKMYEEQQKNKEEELKQVRAKLFKETKYLNDRAKQNLNALMLSLAVLSNNLTDKNLKRIEEAKNLLNADINTLTTEELYNRYTIEYETIGQNLSLLELRLKDATDIIERYGKGELEELEKIFNNVFNNYVDMEALAPTTTGDNFISANNIITSIKSMLCIANKVISEKDLELYRNKESLSEEELKELNNRIRRVKKEKIEYIIAYLDKKKDVAVKEDSIKTLKKELQKLREGVGDTDTTAPLEEQLKQEEADLKEIQNSLREYSKNIIHYNSDYYYNYSPNLPSYINEAESGKIETANEDRSVVILKDQKTAVMENEFTSVINTHILIKISATKKNPIIFTNEEIYSIMHNHGLLYEEPSKASKKELQNAKDLFFLHCTLLNGYNLQHTELKLNKKKTGKKGVGTYIYQVNRNYKGIELYFNKYLLEEVIKQVAGYFILNEDALKYSPNTSNLLFVNSNLSHMHPRGTINGYEISTYTKMLGYSKNDRETVNIIYTAKGEGAIDYTISGTKVDITDKTQSYENKKATARAKIKTKRKKKK